MASRLRARNRFDFGYEIVLIMSRVVVSFVSLKYFETDHDCVREFGSSYINVKVYASLIQHIAACSFQLKNYCFGTWIKERVRFMCSVLVSAHGLLFRHID